MSQALDGTNSSAKQVYEPSQLPLVLKTQDVMTLCRCSRPYALQILRKAERQGVLVLWVGKHPRVNRDAFLDWLSTRKSK